MHRATFLCVRNKNPEIARLTEHLVRWNGNRGNEEKLEARISLNEEAKRAGKIRAVRNALVILGNPLGRP